MKIREKIEDALFTDFGSCDELSVDKQEEIVKDAAIKFAEWMSSIIESNYTSKGSWYVPTKGKVMTSEELFKWFTNLNSPSKA